MSILNTADDELLKLIEKNSSTSSCSCSFCRRHRAILFKGHMIEGRDDCVAQDEFRDAKEEEDYDDDGGGGVPKEALLEIKTGHSSRQREINSDTLLMEVKSKGRDKGTGTDDLFRVHDFCVQWFLDFLQPFYDSREHKNNGEIDSEEIRIKLSKDDGEHSTTQVPTMIICRHGIDFESFGGRRTSIRSNSMRLKILQKADELQATLEKDLKSHTATETMSEYSSSYRNKSNLSSINCSMSDDSSIGMDLIESSQESVLLKSVSSLSCPSFSHSTMTYSKENIRASDHLDPLKVLNLKPNVDAHNTRTQEERNTTKMSLTIKSPTSADEFHECGDSCEDLEYSGVSRIRFYSQDLSKYSSNDQYGLKDFQESFLSYDDILPKNPTITFDGDISYDDDGTEKSNFLSTPLNDIETSYDERPDLDNLCQESVQSARTEKSFDRHGKEAECTIMG